MTNGVIADDMRFLEGLSSLIQVLLFVAYIGLEDYLIFMEEEDPSGER
jgi:hypothetical protein